MPVNVLEGVPLRDAARVVVRGFINIVAGSELVPRIVRFHLLRAWGVDLHTKAINPGFTFSGPNVSIGAGTTINWNAFFEAGARITIEEDCGVAIDCLFLTRTHQVGGPESRLGPEHARPIVVRRGTWLGARVTVQPGVTIGEGCIVAAGAVVTKDCAPHGFYAGVPAQRVRDLPIEQDAA